MNSEKPQSVRIIGLLLIILSSLKIFGSMMGMLAMLSIMLASGKRNSEVFSLYIMTCGIIITAGVLFLFAGIGLRKFRSWGRSMTTGVSGALIGLIWAFNTILNIRSSETSVNIYFLIASAIIGLLISSPLALMIWYFSKKSIRQHFS